MRSITESAQPGDYGRLIREAIVSFAQATRADATLPAFSSSDIAEWLAKAGTPLPRDKHSMIGSNLRSCAGLNLITKVGETVASDKPTAEEWVAGRRSHTRTLPTYRGC